MDNAMRFSYMTRDCDTLLRNYQAQNNRTSDITGASFCDKLVEKSKKDSFWDRRKKKREELLAQLEELEEKKALSKRMARSEYFMELASVRPMLGEPEEPLNCDRLAMQIFSSFKANILLHSFQSKKG